MGCCALKEGARHKMATSSTTANFYTGGPKAANAIARALFTDAPATVPTRHCTMILRRKCCRKAKV